MSNLDTASWSQDYKELLFRSDAAVLCCLVIAIAIFLSPSLDNSFLLLVVLGLSVIAIRNDRRARSVETLRRAQQEDYQILLESVQHNPTAFAVYDATDRLIAWNSAYEALYRKTFQQFKNDNQNQIYYSDLVRCNASEELSGYELNQYVENRVQAQRNPNGSTIDRMYPDCGWFRVSKFVTPSGGVAGFAIDINELKRRETDLVDEVERRRKLEIKILALANTDSLTGINNRRCFMENAENAFNEERDSSHPLIVLMVDIDHFKGINDKYGHAIGDDVIRSVAKAGADAASKGMGIIGRLGGEEFALTFVNYTIADAMSAADEFRETVNSETIFVVDDSFSVSISIGLAQQEPEDHNLSELLGRADKALYQVKTNGRNAVVYLTPDHSGDRSGNKAA